MKLICLLAATCAALAVAASSAGCSPYYCYSTPKIDLSVALSALEATRAGEDADVAPRMTLKNVVDAAVETGTPRSNCLGAAY